MVKCSTLRSSSSAKEREERERRVEKRERGERERTTIKVYLHAIHNDSSNKNGGDSNNGISSGNNGIISGNNGLLLLAISCLHLFSIISKLSSLGIVFG